jgi:hypothetical protein
MNGCPRTNHELFQGQLTAKYSLIPVPAPTDAPGQDRSPLGDSGLIPRRPDALLSLTRRRIGP